MRVLLAALFYLPSSTYLLLLGNAAFTCALSALRGTSGSATMTTPGGAGTTLANTRSHFPCPAHRLLSWVGAPTPPTIRGSGPSHGSLATWVSDNLEGPSRSRRQGHADVHG
jgi:hypothetical protein